MRLRNTSLLFLALTVSCGGGAAGFDSAIRRGLTVSQGTYDGAMNAVDLVLVADESRSEEEKRITPGIARDILEYETRHRTTHNMITTMTSQYVLMREANREEGGGDDQLAALETKINSFRSHLTIIVAELITYLMEAGIYDGN